MSLSFFRYRSMVSNSNPSVFLFFFSLTSVPVCPHGGGVGLCEYIQHISIFDYICVSASLENRLENQEMSNLTVDAASKVPVMDYCDVAWSSIGKIEHDNLDGAQRRAAKIVLKTKDSDPERNLKWLPLSMRSDMHTINLTFKCLKGSPQMFLKIIVRFLEQSTTRGEVGTTCCSLKSELRREGSLFILMDLNFLIILQVK